MTPDQLTATHVPSDPRLSPDGTHVAFVVSTPNSEEDRYDRSIWVENEQFTSGPGDSGPRWSPDGTKLAFLRSVDGEPAQVAVIPVAGGEARVITSFDRGVEGLEWSPDGDRLAVVAVTYTDEWANLDDDERNRRARRVKSVPYRYDNMGWLHDRRRHIWLIDVTGETEPHCLTPGDFDEQSPAWSPDGDTIAFITDRDPRQGLVSGNDVWEVDVASGTLTQVTQRGFWSQVSYRRDGVLHLLGNTESRYPVDAYLYRREDDGSLTDLTGHLDRSSVSPSAGPAAIRWDEDVAIVGFEDSGRFGVIEILPDGTVDTLVRGDKVVTGYDRVDRRLVYTASTWDSPGEVVSDGTPLTNLNDTDLGLVVPDHFTVDSGGAEIDVWVYLPDNDEERVPLLLNIHGGPASQYGYGFFDEFQVYAGAGYGVVACNPRGSAGKGKDFVEAVTGDGWGVVDYADVTAAVAAAMERHPRLDPSRMGLMGGSYGGFMTAWMIGKEDRWKSAVVERALISWTSFSGTSDIAGVFPENYLGVGYPEGWDTYWRQSPLALAQDVTTPTLILHSENDFRCPIEQAEQYFMALLRNGATAELLRFPGEGHEMSRSGKPKHRVERFDAILEWHDRHLK
ncbi:MAG TPA: S9 family peptidase [Acidimicrobiia bacterium]